MLKDISDGARTVATDAERVTLSGWPGWGPMAKAFDPKDATWAGIWEELQQLVDERDLKLALKATYMAFYTPGAVARSMWGILAALGFKGGRVAELGCGAGVFLSTAPAGVSMVGVERDPVSARIAALLNPDATVVNRPLQDVALGTGFSAVVGNVPFGNVKVFDPAVDRDLYVTESLHNYFLYRALLALAPGGYAVLLTSRFTMDSRDFRGREELAALADFVGAIRLPNGGLEGGTEALADIVILRRREADEKPAGHAWSRTTTDRFGWENPLNEWWTARPEMVLGRHAKGTTNQYGLGLLVEPDDDGKPLDGKILAVGRRLAREAVSAGLAWTEPPAVDAFDPAAHNVVTPEGWLENSYHLVGGKVLVVKGGRAQEIPRPGKELVALVKLRDLVKELMAAEADHDRPDRDIEPIRADVRAAYRSYRKRFGPLNRRRLVEVTDKDTGGKTLSPRNPPMGGFRHDPDWFTVSAIEIYDDETDEEQPSVDEAPLLESRQNRRVVLPMRTGDPAQAFAWCLDRMGGRVDLGYIAQLLDVDESAVPGLLGDRVFQRPGDGRWVTREEYLSGDVRAAHLAAVTAAKHDERYRRNAEALEKVLPKWLGPGEIHAPLGAVWIGPKDVAQFIEELLEAPADVVRRVPGSNKWEVEGGFRHTTLATAVWGTANVDAYTLIEQALNLQTPTVRRKLPSGKTEKDPEASLQAAEQQQKIKSRFSEWIWEDPDRAERLAKHYNNTLNCLVDRKFDGSHITVEGMAPEWAGKLYPHQREFIARVLATPATLCGHPVGAGKTATMTCSAMKLKQVGLVDKPMLVVPNHLLDQAFRAAQQLFPAARILAAEAETISKNRRAFTARVAMSPWDLVIITQSAFNAMPVSPDTEREYLEALEAELHSSIFRSAPGGKMSRQVKQLAKRLDKLQARVQQLRHLARGRDAGVTFEQLGVHWVGIDEAHAYKNLAVDCQAEGFTIRPSKRATDLDIKLRWLAQQGHGRYAALFTGTPVSNTMLELYVVMHYTMPEYLASKGLGSADAWTATFVEMVTKVGVTINGGDFEIQTRPARFVNAPELRLMLSIAADIRTADMLGLKRPEAIERVVAIDPTAAQEVFAEQLVERAKRLKGIRFPGKGCDNMLKVCTHGRWMATDPALVGLVDDEPSKLHQVAAEMLAIWAEHPDELQIGFLDVGTPNDAKGPQSYGRLRRMLVDGGMDVRRIRFVHDAKTTAEKAALFRDCRAGKVSVVLGSTEKLGTGTNIQDRVVAMHHIDAPYTPAGVEQRDGRGLRPGNRHERVLVLRYVTKRTFDAYLWQLLVRKLGFISQMMSGNLDRSVEDCTPDQLMSFEAVQATATDQPLLFERAEVSAQVARLQGLRRGWRATVDRMRRDAPRYEAAAKEKAAHAAVWEAIDVAPDVTFTPELVEALGEAMGRASKYFAPTVQVGGLKVAFREWETHGEEAVRHPLLCLDGGAGEVEEKIYGFWKPETVRDRVVKLVGRAAGAAQALRTAEATLLDQARQATEMAGRPFAEADELTAALARLDQIDKALEDAATGDREKDGDVVVEDDPGSLVDAGVTGEAPAEADDEGIEFDADDLDEMADVFAGLMSDVEMQLAADLAEAFDGFDL